MRRSWITQVVVVVLVLNGIHLLFFATSPVAPGDRVESFAVEEFYRGPFQEKPWPELPSYRPWTANSSLADDDCEHVFGNGFTKVYDIIHPGVGHAATDLAFQDVGYPKESHAQRKLADLETTAKEPVWLSSADWVKQKVFDDITRQTGHPQQAEARKVVRGTRDSTNRLQPYDKYGEQDGGTLSWGAFRWDAENMDIGALLGRKAGFGKYRRQYDSFLSQADASFKCSFSETLLTSVCEGSRIVMDSQKLQMSKGGELVADVLGRPDEDELPSFSPGAFSVVTNQTAPDTILVSRRLLDTIMPQGLIHLHTMRNLLESMRTMGSDGLRCTKRIKEPTVFVTRFEYANLFHTVTDWYSAYVASRVAGLKQRPRLIFVDGHCKSPLDDGWEAMFSSVSYAMQYSGQVCFDRAIFVPLGYETPIFKGLQSGFPCQGCALEELQLKADQHAFTSRVREFGEFFVAALNPPTQYGIIDDKIYQNRSQMNVLFIRREDYLAHPRHNGKPESRLSNEEEVYDALNGWAAARSGHVQVAHPAGVFSKLDRMEGDQGSVRTVHIINGLFAHMTLQEQVQMVQDSAIIVGAHGAGLTHAMFAKPGTVILELLSTHFSRPHFNYISQWKGLPYMAILLEGTYANCTLVVNAMDKLVNDLTSLPPSP